jgi:hypothetical protein
MNLTDLLRNTSKDEPSRSPERLPRPPKAKVPVRKGEAYSPTSGGQGGGGTYFEEESVTTREWYPGGFMSSDGMFYFPAIKRIKGKVGEFLQFAAPDS